MGNSNWPVLVNRRLKRASNFSWVERNCMEMHMEKEIGCKSGRAGKLLYQS
jgi:hypothetical protein